MQSIYFYIFALTISAVTARQFRVTEDGSPIEEVYTSYGLNDHERVTYIRAVIRPNHINTAGRNNFPRSGILNNYFQAGMAQGDERGHLVGSQFSGPAEWYNLSPQNMRVNRNAGYQSIITDWYETECEVRRFLNQGGDRCVTWEVTMNYEGNSNRPTSFHLQVNFYENGNRLNAIDTNIDNPLLRDDSTFWICRVCRSNRHTRGASSLFGGSESLCEKEQTNEGFTVKKILGTLGAFLLTAVIAESG